MNEKRGNLMFNLSPTESWKFLQKKMQNRKIMTINNIVKKTYAFNGNIQVGKKREILHSINSQIIDFLKSKIMF